MAVKPFWLPVTLECFCAYTTSGWMATIGATGREKKPPTISPGLKPEEKPVASDPLKLVLLKLPPTSRPPVGGSAAIAGLTETVSAIRQGAAILMRISRFAAGLTRRAASKTLIEQEPYESICPIRRLRWSHPTPVRPARRKGS